MKPIAKKQQNQNGVEANTVAAQDLRNLFETGLNDIYSAEKALAKSLPKMLQNASSPELVNTLKNNLAVTEQNVNRLEKIFKTAGLKASVKKSESIQSLLKETEGIVNQTKKENALDAGIIALGQKLKQYEITSLGNLHTYAKNLGENNVADLLATTLNQTQQTHAALNGIAASASNKQISNINAITNLKKKIT